MNKKRVLGFVLVFLGLFIILSDLVVTGAVVGISPVNYYSIAGIVLVIAGGLLVKLK